MRAVVSKVNNATWDIEDDDGTIIPWHTDLFGALQEIRRLEELRALKAELLKEEN